MCSYCANTGYVMQDIGTATVPDYVEIPCRCNPAPTDEDAPNWLDDPDIIIEGESVLYVPKGWPDDFGRPGETPDCPFDTTPPDPSEYALPAHLLA